MILHEPVHWVIQVIDIEKKIVLTMDPLSEITNEGQKSDFYKNIAKTYKLMTNYSTPKIRFSGQNDDWSCGYYCLIVFLN